MLQSWLQTHNNLVNDSPEYIFSTGKFLIYMKNCTELYVYIKTEIWSVNLYVNLKLKFFLRFHFNFTSNSNGYLFSVKKIFSPFRGLRKRNSEKNNGMLCYIPLDPPIRGFHKYTLHILQPKEEKYCYPENVTITCPHDLIGDSCSKKGAEGFFEVYINDWRTLARGQWRHCLSLKLLFSLMCTNIITCRCKTCAYPQKQMYAFWRNYFLDMGLWLYGQWNIPTHPPPS